MAKKRTRAEEAKLQRDKLVIDSNPKLKANTELAKSTAVNLGGVSPENYDALVGTPLPHWMDFGIEQGFIVEVKKKKENKDKSKEDKDKKKEEEESQPTYIIDRHKLAKYLLSIKEIKTISSFKEERIFIYDKKTGIYNSEGVGILNAEIENLIQTFSTNHLCKEVVGIIKRKNYISSEEFEEPEKMFCLGNGVLDLSDLEEIKFLRFSPRFNFVTKIPVNYDPEATCPKIIKFLEETFYEEDLLQFQEWGGHYLIKRYLFKKAAIIQGPPDTGKTILLKITSHFIGEKNVSGLSLQNISYGKSFDLLSLKDKLVNIFDDLSKDDLRDGGGFKIATGGGYVSGEIKFGDKILFKNHSKLIFACNQIPTMKNLDDDAYFGRYLIWRLDNEVPEHKQDKELLQKLTTPEEMSGLLNWFIEGQKRLISQNVFSNSKNKDEIRELMMRKGNPMAAFAQDCLVKEIGNTVSKQKMFEAYTWYCERDTLQQDSLAGLGRKLENVVPYILSGRGRNSAGKDERHWKNVCLHITDDSYDTFTNNIRRIEKSNNKGNNNNMDLSYINSEKVSHVSHDSKTPKDEKEPDFTQGVDPDEIDFTEVVNE